MPPPPSEPKLLAASWERIRPNLEGFEPRKPSPQDMQTIYLLIQKSFYENGTLDDLPSRLRKQAPWVVFTHPMDAPGKLAKDPSFTEQYLAWLRTIRTPSAPGSLLRKFLDTYPEAFPTFEAWREGLRRVITKSPSVRLSQARTACNQFRLLDKDGAFEFSKLLTQGNDSPKTILEQAGLGIQYVQSAFAVRAYRHTLQILTKALQQRSLQYDMLQRIFELSSAPEGRGLRYRQLAAPLAEALLLPYAEGQANASHIDSVRDFLVERMGDPRIQSGGWIGVSERAKDVMFGWLVKANLEDFFNILSRTANVGMWEARRDFWSDYLNRKLIKNAWVVLGSQARFIAKAHFGSKNPFGELRGATSSQSVLLMQIGTAIIAEWSHMGACYIWNDGNPGAPKMHDTSYAAASLRGGGSASDDSVSHLGDWPYKIRHMIWNFTGIQ